MRVFESAQALRQSKGHHLGFSSWRAITQEQVNDFAAVTDDRQWIHIDPARAASGPFESTIAHGFLTLSLMPSLCNEIFRVDNARMGINYGLDKVRFLNPVPVGSAIRASVEVLDVVEHRLGLQMISSTTVEIETKPNPKPVCVAVRRAVYVYGPDASAS